MRKRRGWLIGFGLGLALGAALLQLMTAAQNVADSPLPTGDTLSLKELKKQAEDKGYSLVLPDASAEAGESAKSGEKTYTQEQLDEAVAAARSEAETDAGKADDQPSSPATDSSAGGQEGASGVEAVKLYVWQNASLLDVANALAGAGLIDDKAAFVAQAKPYSKKLRVGVCTFVGKPTNDEIIAELTRGKN